MSFMVKETLCPRLSQQPAEQCDFKENGLVKQCVGTLSLDRSDDQFGLNCNEDEDLGTRKPVSFTVKETLCPRMTQQPVEQCDFQEKGWVKQCVGIVTLDLSNDQFDLNCNEQDEDPDSPKRVSFRVKETVCPRTTQQPPEQCDFKENGLLKRCEGTVTLDQVRGNFDITCNNQDEDPDSPKRVSFRVKETVCPRTTQQPPEQCDFKENGLLKRCEGTVTLDQVRGNFDITCNNAEDRGARKPVSFKVKETVCPRTSQQPVEQCDFRKNGLVKQCVGTVTRYWIRGDFDITCKDLHWVFVAARRLSCSTAGHGSIYNALNLEYKSTLDNTVK
ncbi:hypothetical protein JEQ12_008504 [Ovis aries]|uniref:Uncharacterized protein n=1 Tax=Ovis aries TaxID=9940 RepID=A0A835ZNT3_SHEEP|nr:hypothetical protein JEQ12_008504 [Ovis aries]